MIRKFLKEDKNNIWWLMSFYAVAFIVIVVFASLPSLIERFVLGLF